MISTPITFSPDGRRIAFASEYVYTDGEGHTGQRRVYIRDLNTGLDTRVTPQGPSGVGEFPPDGTRSSYIVESYDYTDVQPYVRDLGTGATILVNASSDGVPGNGSASGALFSSDGRKVLFSSDADNLIPSDTNAAADVFIKDLVTGVVSRVNVTPTGAQANQDSAAVALSPSGDRVAFTSVASNLAPGDTNGRSELFVKTLSRGAVQLVLTNAAGERGDTTFTGPVKFLDDSRIAFTSDASNLVADDTNGRADLFIKNLESGTVTRIDLGVDAFASTAVAFNEQGTKIAYTRPRRAVSNRRFRRSGLDDRVPAAAAHQCFEAGILA